MLLHLHTHSKLTRTHLLVLCGRHGLVPASLNILCSRPHSNSEVARAYALVRIFPLVRITRSFLSRVHDAPHSLLISLFLHCTTRSRFRRCLGLARMLVRCLRASNRIGLRVYFQSALLHTSRGCVPRPRCVPLLDCTRAPPTLSLSFSTHLRLSVLVHTLFRLRIINSSRRMFSAHRAHFPRCSAARAHPPSSQRLALELVPVPTSHTLSLHNARARARPSLRTPRSNMLTHMFTSSYLTRGLAR